MGYVSTVCMLTPYVRLVGPHAWALCADTLYSPCAHMHASCTCATFRGSEALCVTEKLALARWDVS
eukprot:COSAG01_NODE_37_length_34085_cov_64.376626_35_plen_66_part_00